MNDSENLLRDLSELSRQFTDAMDAIEKQQEEFYNSLTEEQKLMAFCAVVRRIFQGEIKERGTYRYVLYNIFGFGPESYAQAQVAGYLAIHNAIIDEEELLNDFVKHHNLDPDMVSKFFQKYL